MPAHGALLTGTHPRDLGLLNNRQTLDAGAGPTLAEILAGAGYATSAVVGSRILDGRSTGLARGFGAYLAPGEGAPDGRHDAGEVNARAASLMEAAPGPLFLLVHYYDSHEPYDRVPDRLRCALRPDAALDQVLRRRGLGRVDYEDVLNQSRDEPVTEDGRRLTLREMTARYDAAVRYSTERAAQLIRLWEASPHGPGSLVIITSDHGEGLGQHGYWSHGMSLHEEALKVPLLVRWPGGGAAARHGAPVTLLDVVPTVLAAAGVSRPPELSGRPLGESMADGGPTAAWVAQRMRYLPAERPPGLRNWRPGDAFALLDGPWKYIQEAEGPPVLYHRGQDPLEQVNLWRRQRARGEDMARRLRAWLDAHPDAATWPPGSPDPERLRLLRSLGYISP